ncbi:MAG: O-antigen ligase family protein [Myxococcota bacterium]
MTTARRRSRPSRISPLLGVVLSLTLVAAVVGFGGANHWVRLALNVSVLGAMTLTLFASDRRLARAHQVWPILWTTLALVAASLTAWLPFPGVLGPLLAPAWGPDRESGGWGFASLDPWSSLDGLQSVILVSAFGAAAAVWLTTSSRSRRVEWAVIAWTALLVVLAVLPRGGADRYLGLFQLEESTPLFGPFVGQNHLGAALALTLPLHVMRAVRGPGRVLHGALAALGMGVAAWAGSTGPVVIMLVQCGVLLGWLVRPAAVLVPVGIAAAAFATALAHGIDWTLHGRVWIWVASLWAWADHWALGTGLGTFPDAIEPYRTDQEFHRWNHAHNDVLEWLVETGITGLPVLLVLGFAGLQLLRRSRDALGLAAWLGVGGVLLHSLIDFPLRIPAIALGAIGLACWASAESGNAPRASPTRVRWGLGCLTLLAALAVVAQARQAWTTDVARRSAERPELATPVAIALAPTDARLRLARASAHLNRGAVEEARLALADLRECCGWRPSAMRNAAMLHARIGDATAALDACDRAVERGPADHRNWETRARMITRYRPDDTTEAWAEVLRRTKLSRRTMEEAWAAVPVGLVWSELATDLPMEKRRIIAQVLLDHGEAEAVVLIAEELALEGLPHLEVLHASALQQLGRSSEAEVMLRQDATGEYREESLKKLAELLETQERWGEASEAWATVAKQDEHPTVRTRWFEAHARAHGPRETLKLIEGQSLEGQAHGPGVLFLQARLQAELGDVGACRAVLQNERVMQSQFKKRRERALKDCEARR